MEIGLLGPLSVGGAATNFPRRDRVVLAALAVRLGEEVSAEQLADALWTGRPPTSWVKVVQGCIVRLRKTLGHDAIRTTPTGYRLEIRSELVDAVRFERGIGRGRELLTLAQPERAAHVLEEALADWRGPALPELEAWEWGRAEASRLGELRLDGEELRVEAALRTGRHREVLVAARAAVEREPLRERRWSLLALAQYQSGQQAAALRTVSEARSTLATQLGVDPGPDLVDLEQAIRRHDPALLPPPIGPPVRADSPYRGLLPYDVADADDFHGREGDVAACLKRLGSVGTLTVVGPSGSGKSSLVRAGVAARLSRDGFRVAVLAPGRHPLDALTAVPTSGPRRALVVDQCEEAVVLVGETAERERYFAALADYAAHGLLILTVRADHLGDLTGHGPFTRLVERGLYLLSPMDRADLARAIEGPAAAAGLRLEPGLVDLLIREVEGEPGALPLLSHALRTTWELREGNTLTVSAYQATGGVRGAVAKTAETVWGRVPLDQRSALRDLVLRLVVPSPEGAAVRSRIPRRMVQGAQYDELIEQLIEARLLTSDRDVIELAHEALVRAWPRLQDWLEDDANGQRILRHLVSAADSWDLMGRPESELYRGTRLTTALEWQARTTADLTPRETEFLDTSRRLAEREERRAVEQVRRQRRVNRRLRVLLAGVGLVSAVAVTAGAAALRQTQRADDQARVAAAERDEAVALALAAASRSVLDSDPPLAVALAAESIKATSTPLPQATVALAQARIAFDESPIQLTGEPLPGEVSALAFDPEGDLLAGAAGRDGVVLWDLVSNRRSNLTLDGAGRVTALAFNGDGSLLATAGPQGARLWEAGSGEPAAIQPSGPRQELRAVAFAEDGSRLATAGRRGVTVWDLETGRLAPRQPDGADRGVTGVAFSPDGTRLVAVNRTGTADLWDVASGHVVSRDLGAPGNVAHAAFTPKGLLATSGQVGAVSGRDGSRDALRLWNPRTGRQLGEPLAGQGDAGQTYLMAISPRGTMAATVSSDNLVRVWDWSTGRPIGNRLVGHSYDLQALAFSSDGRQLAAAGYLGSVLRWGVRPERFTSRGLAGTMPDFSPDGALVSTVDTTFDSRVGGLRLWDASSARLVSHPSGWPPNVQAADFSPDGETLAVATRKGVTLADPDTGEPTGTPLKPSRSASSVGFSPNGSLLAAGQGPRVEIWDPDTLAEVATLRVGDDHARLRALAFDPRGDLLATAAESDGGLVRLWAASTGAPVGRPLVADKRWVESLAFSPDGRLVTGGADGTVRIWDTATGHQIERLDAHTGIVSFVQFSPDGALLASGGLDNTTRLWDARTGDPIGGALKGSGVTLDWLSFNPRADQVAVAGFGRSGTGLQLWDWDVNHACALASAYVAAAKVARYLPDGAPTRCSYSL